MLSCYWVVIQKLEVSYHNMETKFLVTAARTSKEPKGCSKITFLEGPEQLLAPLQPKPSELGPPRVCDFAQSLLDSLTTLHCGHGGQQPANPRISRRSAFSLKQPSSVEQRGMNSMTPRQPRLRRMSQGLLGLYRVYCTIHG